LALQSTYFFQQLYADATPAKIHRITLVDTTSVDFESVLRFMYKGEVDLDSETVGRVLRLAKFLRLDELAQICVQFMRDTLDIENCVRYWRLVEEDDDSDLGARCKELLVREFTRVVAATDLRAITQGMMTAAIASDDLDVGSEFEVYEILIKWFDANLSDARSVRPLPLLCLIRWSGIPTEYIRSKMISRDVLMKDMECFDYLSKVVCYGLTGIQFDGLRTRHRQSTGLETCVVVFGTDTGHRVMSDSCCVSLQSSRSAAIANVPTDMRYEVTACVSNNLAYLSGVGVGCKETWRWDSVGGWARCGDMVEGRRRHCATFVNNTSMYALGGFVDASSSTLASVEQFSTIKNQWTTVGQLVAPVRSAACVTYAASVYLFGGSGREGDSNADVDLDCIQAFDSITKQGTLLSSRLPRPERLLRAVLWDRCVVLMNNRSCMIFSLERRSIQQRDQFAPGVVHFGLVVDDQMLFVIGGGLNRRDVGGKQTWTCVSDVRCTPIRDVVSNAQTVNWIGHASLKSASLVQAYSLMTLPAV
jgi:hypothetical protein